ncbi:MAG: NADH-dependent [FeFe] hydrogenase, group A6 [Spirochaetaceae bacterium]
MIKVVIDNKEILVEKDTTILEAAKILKISIPTLCYHKDLIPLGLCRICLVEIKGVKNLVASCSYKIISEMEIYTFSDRVREARQTIIDLMISSHDNNCTICDRADNCELQQLAVQYGSSSYPYGNTITDNRVYNLSSSISRDYSKCIQCRRCIQTCDFLQDIGIYGVKNRGSDTQISTFNNNSLIETKCINCGQCINRCPTGALKEIESITDVWEAIKDPNKYVVIQTAPAPRAAIGECFNYPPGNSYTYQLNTALKKIGFNNVFDTCFTADLTIIEEGTELLERIKKAEKLPLFTSCSPGWIKYIEHNYPEYLNNLSTSKSPHEMFGAIIKTYYAKKKNIDPKNIVVVSLMPCTAKKFEILRPEMVDSGYQDVDYVLTTREIGKMIKQAGLELKDLGKTYFDDPFGDETGSGIIFASTGGVMESALRTVYHITTGTPLEAVTNSLKATTIRGFDGVKYAEFKIETVADVPQLLSSKIDNFDFLLGATLKVAVCHGTKNAKKVLDNIKNGGEFSKCHFIEFMACPGGCLGGGGQPIPTNDEIRKQRMFAVYNNDEESETKLSSYNSAVLEIYSQFFNNQPGGELAHKLLHTQYIER